MVDEQTDLNISGRKVYEEGVEGFGYTASVFDPFQKWQDNFPVVDTAADVLLLVIVRINYVTLDCETKKTTSGCQEEKVTCHINIMQS